MIEGANTRDAELADEQLQMSETLRAEHENAQRMAGLRSTAQAVAEEDDDEVPRPVKRRWGRQAQPVAQPVEEGEEEEGDEDDEGNPRPVKRRRGRQGRPKKGEEKKRKRGDEDENEEEREERGPIHPFNRPGWTPDW